MHVQFIYPNLNAEEGFNHGIAALSGCLKARGHRTSLLNINEALDEVPTDEQVIEWVRQQRPDFIAFSVMTQQYKYSLRLAKKLRAAFPRIPIGIGGVHTIMCTEQVKNDGFWDFIGVGECDETFAELIDKLDAGDPDYVNVGNFCVRRPDGSYQQNPLAPYPALDTLPPKDYEIFDLQNMLGRKNGWQSILTSRGCPYRCTYCFNHEVTDRYLEDGGHSRKSFLRHYPTKRILDEIRELKKRHPYIETIIFDDDLFTLNKDYCIDFCKAYADAGIDVPFVLNAHVQTFTEPVAKALSESPCMIVKFGVESGSYELRKKVLERHMTNEAIIDAFDLCHEYGLHTSAFLMFGLPYEDLAMMDETIDLMARIRPGRMRWAIFFPFPGTKSYTICKLGDLIDYRKMDGMDNFFCASCLKFDDETDLYIRKLQRTFHWRVNARASLAVSDQYAGLVDEIDALTFDDWHEVSDSLLDRDRAISNEILAGADGAMEPVKHYSIRYTEVMAVDSDFILAEKGDYKNLAARRWKAFRENIDASRSAAAHLKQTGDSVATTLNGANGTVGDLEADAMRDAAGAGCVNAAPKGKVDMPGPDEQVAEESSCTTGSGSADTSAGIELTVSASAAKGADVPESGATDDEQPAIGAGEWRSIPKDGSGISAKGLKQMDGE